MKCKKCNFNNNGWCKKYKMQKPKAIVKCEEDKNDDKIECCNEKYIVNGKMQQFSNIIRQIEANPECCTNEFKEVLKTLYNDLEINIKIHGIALDYEMDKILLEDLRYRMRQW